MELDEMKSAWATLDRRLQRQETLNLQMIRETKFGALRATLRPFVVGRIGQILVGVLLGIVFGSFWIEHRETPHLLVIGLLLHAYALMFILFAARDLYLVGRVDYSSSVVDIQRRLAELRAWRVRVAWMFGAVGCFHWILIVLWLFYVVFGFDLYAVNPAIVYLFVASGFACLAIMLAALRWARNPRRAQLAKNLMDGVVGRSIGRAQRLVDEIGAFARES